MAEPDDIVAAALAVGGAARPRRVPHPDHRGRQREPLDPVRFDGNRSSGKQGVALARAAAARAARGAAVAEPRGGRARGRGHPGRLGRPGVDDARAAGGDPARRRRPTWSSWRRRSPTTVPRRSRTPRSRRRPRATRSSCGSCATPNSLRELTSARREDQVVVGFAAGTPAPSRGAALELGRAKAARKGVDYLVLSRVGWSEGFATERNAVIVLDAAGAIVGEADGPRKTSVADRILDLVSLHRTVDARAPPAVHVGIGHRGASRQAIPRPDQRRDPGRAPRGRPAGARRRRRPS